MPIKDNEPVAVEATKSPTLEGAIKVFHEAYFKTGGRMNAGIEAVWNLIHPEEKHG